MIKSKESWVTKRSYPWCTCEFSDSGSYFCLIFSWLQPLHDHLYFN